MALSDTRKGELYMLLQAVLWSLFPVVTKLSFHTIPPLLTAGLSTAVSSLFFAAVLTAKGGWRQMGAGCPWRDILLATFFIGILFYGFTFVGLSHTTAGNAAIMGLMEVFFSFLILAVILKREKFIPKHALGAVCMVLGALFVLLPSASHLESGDLLILLGTMCPPLGNMYIQQARRKVSSECILFVRSVVSGIFLLCLGLVFEQWPGTAALQTSWLLIACNGLLALGLTKILWIEGTRLIPITKGISLSSIEPLFTLFFASLLLHETVRSTQILALVPIMIGVLLLTAKTKKKAALEMAA